MNPKTVTLVGHCGPDSSFLRMAVSGAAPGVVVTVAADDREVDAAIENGVDLLLFNRVLDYGYSTTDGIGMLRNLKQTHPDVKMMMVSNYPEALTQAEEAGALPGFGKREIGTEKVKQRLADALKG